MINKSASCIGLIEFKNGNQVELFVGVNNNLGTDIIWQRLNGGKAKRTTGKNIKPFVEDLDHVLNEGIARWVGVRNDAALDHIKLYLS